MKRFLTCALSGIFFIWLPNAFADDNSNLLMNIPGHIRQAQGDGNALLTLRVDNIQVQAEWRVDNAADAFDISDGVLSLVSVGVSGTQVVTIYVEDEFDLLNPSYTNLTASAVITVEFESGLSLSDAPRLTAVAGEAVSLHTFAADGGSGTNAYTLVGDDVAGYFALGENSGVLSLLADTQEGVYTLTVRVKDERDDTAEALATVEVSAALSLTDAPPLFAVVREAVSLHTFAATGGIGDKTYTLVAGSEDYFSLGTSSGVLSIQGNAPVGIYTLSVEAADVGSKDVALAIVEVRSSLSLSAVPLLTVATGESVSLQMLVASGGIGTRTYTLVSGNELGYFAVDAVGGVLSLRADATVGMYTLTVGVKDERDNTAEALALVEVSAALSLAGAPSFTVIAGVAMSLHTFSASGGIGIKTYTLVSDNELGYFSVDAVGGVLSLRADAAAGVYTLTVQAMDEHDNTAEALATVEVVEVSAALSLADAPSFTVIAGVALSLHTFAASGGIGIKTYTLVAGNENNYFSLDAVSGVLSLHMNAPVGIYTLSVEVADVSGKDVALAFVEVRSSLSLSAVPLLTVVAGESVSLQMLVASGGIGARTYTLVSGNELGYFAVDALSGALSLLADAREGLYTLTVGVKDERDNTAEALAVVAVSAVLSLTDAPPLFAVVGVSVSLHTFAATGGIGDKTYTLVAGSEDYFSLGTSSGVLSIQGNAPVGIYTLSVQAVSADDITVQAMATVNVLSLFLSDAPALYAIVGREVSLYTFAAMGVIGAKTYTIVAGNKNNYFSLGASSGVLSIQGNAPVGIYTLSVEAADVSSKDGALAFVEVRSSLSLSAVPLLTVAAGESVSLQMLVASGGIGARTYTLVSGNELGYFAVDALSGALSLLADAREGLYTLTVGVKDERDNTAEALAVVEVSAALSLSGAPPFTVIASVALSLHTFAASGGIGIKTYTLVLGNELGYFTVDAVGGVLSLRADAAVGVYTLTVQAMDEHDNTAEALALVEVSAALSLSDAPSFTVIAGVALSLHTFAATGGIGDKTYTLVAGSEDYFRLGASSGVLSIQGNASVGIYTLSVEVADMSSKDGALAFVEVRSSLSLSAVPLLTVAAGESVSLQMLVASGGIGTRTYTLVSGNELGYFAVDALSGALSLLADARDGLYTLTVGVKDERDNTAEALAVVAVSAALSLSDAPPFTVIASVALSLHTFSASGGIGIKTYTLVSGNELGYFAVDAASGVLSLRADVAVGVYTLTVQAMDEHDNTAEALATVEVLAALSLTDAPPLFAAVGEAVSLHTFAATGGIGDKTYTLVAGSEDYFSLGTSSGVLSIQGNAPVGIYTLSVEAVSTDGSAVQAMAMVEVLSLFLADAPPLYAIVGREVSLYTFSAMGVIGAKTYTIAVGNENNYFSLGASSGVLSIQGNASVGIYTLSVEATDVSSKDVALAFVEVRSSLSLSAVPLLTVAAGESVSLQMLVASGGIGTRTYTLVSGNELGYFAVDALSGALSLLADARDGLYTLTVGVKDERDNTAEALAVVAVSAALSLAGVPPFTVIASVALSLHTFSASGGIGIKTYTLVSGNELGYFAVDAASGALSVKEAVAAGLYTLSVEVSDNAGNQASVPVTVDVLPPLFVTDALSFSARVGQAVSLYTFSTTDRVGAQTYILAAGNDEGYFSLDAGWVLSVSNQATVGMYQLLLEGSDRAGNQATAVVRVRIMRDGIFILGGHKGDGALNDVWSSADGKSWMQDGDGGWSARYAHQAVVHQGRLYVLGGWNGSDTFNDVWSLVINSWVQADDAGWSARYGHQAVSHNGRLYVLGGFGGTPRNDVWSSVDGGSWSLEKANNNAGWSARHAHQAVSHNGRIYVLGGTAGTSRNDVWSSVDGKSWSLEIAEGAGGWEGWHKAVSHNGRIYVLGGYGNGNNHDDVWSSVDGKNWRQEMVAGWPGRWGIQAVSYQGRLYVLGGNDGSGFNNDVWSLADGESWTLETADAGWSRRFDYQAVAFPPPLILLGTGARLRLTVGLSSANIYTFQAQYGVGNYTYSLSPAEVGFGIDNNGALSTDGSAPMGSYTLTVRAEDEMGALAQAAVHVDVALSALPLLTVSPGEVIYTFTVVGGIGEKTYAIVAGNDAQYFTLGGASGKLSVRAGAEAGKYILQVKISDNRGDYAAGPVTVKVALPLSLAGVSLTNWARLPGVVTLHDFAVSSGIGAKGYTFAAGNDAGYFALDEISGVLSLPVNPARLAGDYTLSVVVSDSAVPPYRVTAVAAVRLMKNAVIVLGGITDLEALSNDVWSSFDVRSWRQANNSAGWPARDHHQALPHNGRLYVLGGDDGARRNDVWSSLDGRSWRQEKANNSAGWSPRESHQAVSHNGRLYVLGGFDGSRKKDVWSSADGKSWTLETGSAGWSSREKHQAVSYNGRLYVLGGLDGSAQNDVWSSVDGKSWMLVTMNAAWSVRRDHQVVLHNERLYVLGGATGAGSRKNDVWSSVDGKSWRQEKANNSAGWGKRRNHQAVSYEGRLYVLGGFDGGRRNDVWSSADGKIWSQEADAIWSARQGHQAVVLPPPLALPGVNPLGVVAGLQAPNIHTFEAQYGPPPYIYSLSPVIAGFSIDESHGVLSADGSAPPGNYTLTVWVKDEEGLRAQTEVHIEMTIFGEVPLLFALAGRAEVIYTFDTMEEMNNHTYTLAAGNGDGYFSLEAMSGALSVTEEAAAGLYTLSVKISDNAGNQASVLVTVDVLPPLFVADSLSFTVKVGQAVSLYTFSTTDRAGAQTYILAAGNEAGYFSLDAGWVLSVSSAAAVGMYQLLLEGSDRAGNQATAVVRVLIIRDGIFVLGGYDNSNGTFFDDVWLSAEGKSWTPVVNGDWSARYGHQAVVHQGRLYVLGGNDGSNTFNDVWSLVNNSWMPAGNAGWSARSFHQAVSHNGRLYVLGGGAGASFKNDVWSLVNNSWMPAGNAGWSARSFYQAVSHNGRLYVLGGFDGSRKNDVWSSADGGSWSQETAAVGWSARYGHQAVSYNGRLYVLGGNDGSGNLNDVWSSADGKSWRQEKANDEQGWSARISHQAVSYKGRLYVLGGRDSADKNDVWSSVDGKSWSQEPAADWLPRGYHQAVVFPKDLVLWGVSFRFGLTVSESSSNIHTFQAQYGVGNYTYSLSPAGVGFSIDNNGVLSADGSAPIGSYTLTLQAEDETGLSTQTELYVDVAPPLSLTGVSLTGWARLSMAVTLHDFAVSSGVGAKRYTLVVGNDAGYFVLDEISGVLSLPVNPARLAGDYTLSLEVSDSDEPPSRVTVAVKVRLAKNGIFVMGGDDGARRNDVWWSADDKSWTEEAAAAWSARSRYQAVVHNGRLYVLGGFDGNRKNDVWSSGDGKNWREETAAAAWLARYAHQVVSHRGRLYVLGGYSGGRLNDVWSSGDGKSWREETAAAAWSARSYHQAVSHRGRLYVLGGYDGDGRNDVWSSADGISWTEEAAAAAWSLRSHHQVVSYRGRLYVLGGLDSHNHNDVWSSGDGKSWTEETAAAAWSARYSHQVVSRDGRLYVLGGLAGNFRNDVWWSADGKSWTEETAAAWSARDDHQAVVFPSPLALLGGDERLRLTLGMSSSNVATFQVHYGVGAYTYSLSPAEVGFSIDNHGVLSADGSAPMGSYTLTVRVEDEEGSSAQTELPMDVALPELPLLTTFAGKIIYTFTVSGGIGEKTYTIEDGDGAQYFTLGGASGKLSVRTEAEAGKYTLQVKISDSRGDYAAGAIMVEVLPTLSLAGVLLTGWARLSVAVTLHDFAVSSGIGAKRYTLVAGNDAGYFVLDEISGVLSLPVKPARLAGDYTLSLVVSDSYEPPNRVTAVVKVRLAKNGIFVLGGYDGGGRNDVWSSADSKSWREEMTAAAWSARYDSQAVSHNGRLYVLGGYDGGRRNDVWSSTDGKSWREETAGAAWSARYRHQVVSHNGRLYVLGGYDGVKLNDVWSSTDGKSWREETAEAAWSARHRHQAVSHNGRLYVLGGLNGSRKNDVWSSADGESWREETAEAAWSARHRHQVVSHQGRLYVLGGYGGGRLNDVWSSADGKSWREETAAAAWSARLKHQAVSRDGRLYVLGGLDSDYRHDVWWSADGKSWREETAAAWSGRDAYQAVVFPSPLALVGLGEKIILTAGVAVAELHTVTAQYGVGQYTYSLSPGVAGFDIDEGSEVLSAAGIAAAGGYTLTVWVEDEEGSRAQTAVEVEVVNPLPLSLNVPRLTAIARLSVTVPLHTFAAGGGHGSKRYTLIADESGYFAFDAASGELSLPSNSAMLAGDYTLRVEVSDGLISPQRATAVVTVRLAKNGIFVLGGESSGLRNDVWSSADGENWRQDTSNAGWTPRQLHQAVAHNGRLYVMGGADGGKRKDVWSSVDGANWQRETDAAWPAREIYQAVSYNGRLYVLGGLNGGKRNDVWSSADGVTWREDKANNSANWTARDRHQAVVHNGRIWLLGGQDSGGGTNDVWSSANGSSWRFEGNADWDARYFHQAVSHAGRLYVLGGSDGSVKSDVWSSVDGRRWEQEKSDNNVSWSKRYRHQSLSRDGLLYVLGGQDSGGGTNDVWSSADGKSWTKVTDAAWSARVFHQAVVFPSPLALVGLGEKIILTQRGGGHTLTAQYGGGQYTYSLSPGVAGFDIDESSGVLSADGNAAEGGHMLTVWVEDEEGSRAQTAVEVEVRLAKNGIFVLGGWWGGSNYSNDVWWSADGESWQQGKANNSVGWPSRQLHQAVAHNGRMYVLGGYDGTRRNDVWSSADGENWQQEKANNSVGWTARDRHQAVVHNGRLYVLGGYDGAGRNDVWSSADGENWGLVTGSADWLTRTQHQAVVHNGRIYVMGGYAGGYRNDVWSSADGENWDLVTGSADWPARARYQAAVHNGRIYVLGGFDGHLLNDVWSSADGSSWRFEGNADWGVREFHQAVSYAGRLYVLGGDGSNYTNDVWSSADGKNWTEETAAAWSVRRGHQAVVFPSPLALVGLGEKIILTEGVAVAELHTVTAQYGFGQYTYSLSPGVAGFDIDESSGVLSAEGNVAVGGYTLMVWVEDQEGSRAQTAVEVEVRLPKNGIFVLGGWWGFSNYSNDVWLTADGKNWQQEKANNSVGWPSRHLHQAVVHNGRMYVLGGDGGTRRNDVWSSADGENWQQEKANNSVGWKARQVHQAVVHNGRMYVLGGYDGARRNDVWSSADGENWGLVTGSAGWLARTQHQAVVHNGRIYVLGGYAGSYRNDVWSSADGENWDLVTGSADWTARARHQAVVHNGRMYVLGGYDGSRQNDVWSSADGSSWRFEGNADWGGRDYHQAVSHAGHLYVLGGYDGSNYTNDVWSSADGKNWTVETAAAWSVRRGHQAVVFPSPLALVGLGEKIILTQGGGGHTLTAQYGFGQYTYSLSPGVTGFDIDESSGVLSAEGNVAVGGYTLTVWVEDEEGSRAQTAVEVEVANPLPLSLNVPLLAAIARLPATVSLHTFAAGGGYGSKRYTLIADESGYFALDAASGELSLPSNSAMLVGDYTLRVEASDGLIPPQRATAAVTVRLAKNGIFVLGGYGGGNRLSDSNNLNDVWWSADGESWRPGKANNSVGWTSRFLHQAVAHNGRLYVLGGYDGALLNDVWSSENGENWDMVTGSAGWSTRSQHQAVVHNGRMYVLGGDSGFRRNDVWSSADGENWDLVTDSAGWSARSQHQAVVHNGRMYVLGGNGGSRKNDVWSSTDGSSWRFEGNADWDARDYHQVVSHAGRLYVLGGYDGNNYTNDVWSSLDGRSWTLEKANNTDFWTRRGQYQALSRDGLLYVLGGDDGSRRNDVWSSADGRSWTKETDAAWSVRMLHQALVFPPSLVLSGTGEVIILNEDGRGHTFTAQYGFGQYTYSLSPGVAGFGMDESSGVLSADGNAAVGGYTLTVWVEDEEGLRAQTAVEVEVVNFLPLSLAKVPRLTVIARLSAAVALHTFAAGGGFRSKRYTIIANEAGYFAIDEASGELSLPSNSAMLAGDYTLWVEASDSLSSPQRATATVMVRIIKNGIFVLGGNESQTAYKGLESDVWWSTDGESWRENTSNAAWSARETHQVVAHRGRMYLMGGHGDFHRLNDVWSSVDSKNWSLVTGSAGWSAREYHQAVVHNGRMYVLGGNDNTIRKDVWSSADGVNWKEETGAAAWSARQGLQAVSHNGRLYVLGGNDGSLKNDVWSSADGANWSFEGNAEWTGRWLYKAVSHNGRLYILGGNDGGRRNDVWSSLDGRSWVEEQANNNAFWTKRGRHQALSRDGLLYVLGGNDGSLRKDVWSSSDGKNWTEETSSAGWGAREYHRAVVFPPNLVLSGTSEVIILTAGVAVAELHTVTAQYGVGQYTYSLAPGVTGFGIDEGSGVLSAESIAAVGGYTLTVWVEDEEGSRVQTAVQVEAVNPLPLSWAKVPRLTAIARLSVTVSLHTLAAGGGHGSKRYTIIADEAGYFALDAASGELSLPSNSAMLAGDYTLRVEASDGLISPQRATAAVMVRLAKNGIFVLGGDVGGSYRNDVWWAVGGKNWRQEQENNEAGRWSSRRYHQAVSHQGRLYVLGGSDGDYRNDVWSSAGGKSWRQEKASDEQGWSGRFRHQAVSHQGLLYVLGGFDGGYRKDVWSSADGVSWTEETSAAAWSARSNYQAVVHNGRLYVLGGFDGGYYNDVWSSADGVSWAEETSAAAWPARSALQAVSHQGRLYVLGGFDGGYHNDVWSSAAGETWRQEKASDGQGWSGRFRHQVVSRDGLLYVLGGAIGNSLRNDVWSSADGRSWTKVTDAAWSVRRAHQAVVFPSSLALVGLGEKITLAAGVAVAELHTLTAQYGGGQYTYSLSPGVTGFDIDEGSGVLSAESNAAVGDYTLTVQVEDEEGSQAETVVQVEIVAASTAALSAVERFAWGGSGGSRNDVGLSEHGDNGRREGEELRRSQQAMRYQGYVLDGG